MQNILRFWTANLFIITHLMKKITNACMHHHRGNFPQIWVNSPHNGSGYYSEGADDRFNASLATGDVYTAYARSGYLGFIKRTDFTQTDGGEAALY